MPIDERKRLEDEGALAPVRPVPKPAIQPTYKPAIATGGGFLSTIKQQLPAVRDVIERVKAEVATTLIQPAYKPAVQPAPAAPIKTAAMPINTECNDVECLTMQVLKDAGLDSSSSGGQQQPPTASATSAATAAPAPAPTAQKAGFPIWMVGVGALVAFSLLGGKKSGKGGGSLSGVPAKRKATGGNKKATGSGNRKATAPKTVKSMSV